jgi:hypothetical protein
MYYNADFDLNAQAYNEGGVMVESEVDPTRLIIHRRSCGVRGNTKVVETISGPEMLKGFDSGTWVRFCETCCIVKYGSPLGVGYMRGRPRRNLPRQTVENVCGTCHMVMPCDCERG